MDRYEYQITGHSAESFDRVNYFCTEEGKCGLNDVPGDQLQAFMGILNEQGQEGWELVQLFFGAQGVLAFWKRRS
ncbi:MAG: hypothetical protein JSV21_05190 [Nitrospirota bacterium]|nr:MAG: hypothetical protein JSV21_05190 [Nitrospirota bacterium]